MAEARSTEPVRGRSVAAAGLVRRAADGTPTHAAPSLHPPPAAAPARDLAAAQERGIAGGRPLLALPPHAARRRARPPLRRARRLRAVPPAPARAPGLDGRRALPRAPARRQARPQG